MNATSVAVLLLHLQWEDVVIVTDDDSMKIFLYTYLLYFVGVAEKVSQWSNSRSRKDIILMITSFVVMVFDTLKLGSTSLISSPETLDFDAQYAVEIHVCFVHQLYACLVVCPSACLSIRVSLPVSVCLSLRRPVPPPPPRLLCRNELLFLELCSLGVY